MMSDELTQQQADQLFAMPKKPTKIEPVKWPDLGKKIAVELLSADEREIFLLDVERSYVKLSKLTLQNRARVTICLARLDIDGAPHRNPDDVEIACPHLHLYREGYGSKWAFVVPVAHFKDLSDRKQTVADFMRYCSIIDPPVFVEDLLS
jgi:hypothetical protein